MITTGDVVSGGVVLLIALVAAAVILWILSGSRGQPLKRRRAG